MVSGRPFGTHPDRVAKRQVSEATLGSSHWVLELCDYRHNPS